MNKGLYIHIPFCGRKCSYCDFYSVTDRSYLRDRYTDTAVRNILHAGYVYDTVYFGGGTPSLMEPRHIERILSAADITAGAEITMEANPESVNPEKLRAFGDAGVNRLSFGVQTFSDDVLKGLWRLHDGKKAADAIKYAHKAGFENISADLMAGLPFPGGKERIKSDIETLVSLGITHVSVYMLKVEKGTPLSENKDLVSVIDDDVSAEEYETAAELLEKNGIFCYEISNFAVKGFECKHNLKYWKCEEYYGTGPAAHSCTDGKRYMVPADVERYISSPVQDVVYTDEESCGEDERLMLRLRLREWIALEEFPFVREKIGEFAGYGLAEVKDGLFRFSQKGLLLSNALTAELLLERDRYAERK
ncbi:MAG: radical SAM family heme chaperone HemW [Oscillospiraceae bacterium]|nr:radical SAM family heme chaperone HemW [Oscillospiraceae bacterium]